MCIIPNLVSHFIRGHDNSINTGGTPTCTCTIIFWKFWGDLEKLYQYIQDIIPSWLCLLLEAGGLKTTWESFNEATNEELKLEPEKNVREGSD